MKETTIKNIIVLAKQLHAQGKKWHFHMLAPNCLLNKRKGKHAFILESEEETYITYSDTRHMAEGKALVALLHGASIVEAENRDPVVDDKKLEAVLEKARAWNERNLSWHHHVLFPACVFNKAKGKWCIIIEDPDGKKAAELVSEDEPRSHQKAIELLFYQQKK
jgi:hypothetical protein